MSGEKQAPHTLRIRGTTKVHFCRYNNDLRVITKHCVNYMYIFKSKTGSSILKRYTVEQFLSMKKGSFKVQYQSEFD